MRRLILLPLFALALLFAGCSGCGVKQVGTATVPLRPGAISQFDQQTYDTLMVIQATLNAAKPIVAAKYPNLKDTLNQAGAAYTTAQAAWHLYHTKASSAPIEAALAQQLADLQHAVANLSASLGGAVQ